MSHISSPSLSFLSQSLSLDLKFILLARPAGQQVPGICLFLPPQHGGYKCALLPPTFYVGAKDPSSGSASTCFHELLPCSLSSFFIDGCRWSYFLPDSLQGCSLAYLSNNSRRFTCGNPAGSIICKFPPQHRLHKGWNECPVVSLNY